MVDCPECGADVGTEMTSSCPECGARLTLDDYERSDGGYPSDGDDPWDDAGDGSRTEEPTDDSWGDAGNERGAGTPTDDQWGDAGSGAGTGDQWGNAGDAGSGTGTGDQWSKSGGNAEPAGSTTDQWSKSGGEPGTADPKPDDGPHRRGLLDFSLKYPIAGGYKPLAIGSVLFVAGFLIVPFLALYGYGVRLGRAAMRGDPTPPQFGDWGGLIGDGLRLVAVSIPYAIAVGVTIGVSFYLESFLLLGLSSLVIAYVGGAIYPTFIATGSVTKTYSRLRFLKFATTVDYLKGIAVLFVLQLAIMMVVGMIALILLVAVLLAGIAVSEVLLYGLFLLFPVYLVAFIYVFYLTDAVWGHVYYTAAENGTVPPVDNPETLGTEF